MEKIKKIKKFAYTPVFVYTHCNMHTTNRVYFSRSQLTYTRNLPQKLQIRYGLNCQKQCRITLASASLILKASAATIIEVDNPVNENIICGIEFDDVDALDDSWTEFQPILNLLRFVLANYGYTAIRISAYIDKTGKE